MYSKFTFPQMLKQVKKKRKIFKCSNKVSQSPAINLNEDNSLEDLIRESIWFSCDICDFKSKSKKGLRIHTVKSHPVKKHLVTEFLSGITEFIKSKNRFEL